MGTHKQTTDRGQIWTFGALLLLACGFFGYAILPFMDPAASPLVGKPAPDFTLPMLSGGEPGSRWSLKDQRGKVVVLDFWASWCAPCRAQAPVIERVANKLSDEAVVVVGVNTADKLTGAMDFVRLAGLSYPMLRDESGKIASGFKATALPTLIIVDAEGQLVASESRVLDETELTALVREAQR